MAAFFDSQALLWFLRFDARDSDLPRPTQAEGLVTNVQMVCEGAEIIQTRNTDADAARREAGSFLELAYAMCRVEEAAPYLPRAALEICRELNMPLSSALLLAAARQAECECIYSTILPDGLAWRGLRVISPYRQHALGHLGDDGVGVDPAERLRQLYQRPGFLIRRAHQIFVAMFEAACAELSLTTSQYTVLAVLDARPGVNQTALARMAGLDKVTVSHLIRSLEQRGLLERAQVLANRRSRVARLTPAGRHLLRRADPCTNAAYAQLMVALTPLQQERLLCLLSRLTRTLGCYARTPLPDDEP